jgi:hypothetical protein
MKKFLISLVAATIAMIVLRELLKLDEFSAGWFSACAMFLTMECVDIYYNKKHNNQCNQP